MVSVRPGVDMYRQGSGAPALSIQIWSIGVFDEARNPKYTQDIYKYLLEKTNLPPQRYTFKFPVLFNKFDYYLQCQQSRL